MGEVKDMAKLCYTKDFKNIVREMANYAKQFQNGNQRRWEIFDIFWRKNPMGLSQKRIPTSALSSILDKLSSYPEFQFGTRLSVASTLATQIDEVDQISQYIVECITAANGSVQRGAT